ncbi:hypothetical protein C0Q70_03550 [Pomacea canaliculata]|uniref:Neogenin n=1 Tax=Pomacea canaliculata TaxID=400727 RepID=A0A2T7PT23_POMCA|nr:hypothetical protein C0Q70_03550 [Pomacea canaliculata]
MTLEDLRQLDPEPVDVSVGLNDTAMFECMAEGLPTPQVRWFKSSWLLQPSSNVRIYPTGTLEISLVQPGDVNTYYCEVQSSERLRRSQRVRLSIQELSQEVASKAPEFSMRPRDQRVVVGEAAYFHCAAKGRDHQGKPPLLSWLRDGITIDLREKFQCEPHITHPAAGHWDTPHYQVQVEDAGIYTCEHRMLKTQLMQKRHSLCWVVPPYFVKKPGNVFAYTHSDATLECEVAGFPTPQVSWLKDGEHLYPSDYFQLISGGRLKILGLMNSDQGMYQCFAHNNLGDVQASAQLVVLQPETPLPTTHAPHAAALPAGALYSDVRKLPATPTNLRAVLVSRRFITVSWQRPENSGPDDIIAYSVYWSAQGSERERVSNTTQTEFNIQHLKPDTSYEVRVRAYNKHGPSQREATIVVTTDHEVHVPSPPVNLVATPLSSSAIYVHWGVPQEPKGDISHYSLVYYQVGSTGETEIQVQATEHTLSNLNAFQEYSVRVVAHNQIGPGMSTAEVVARTFSTTPTATPENFTLEVTSATRIVVRWQPPPPETQNGIIVGYKIRFRAQGDRGGDTVVTDGNRNTYVLTDLEKGTIYRVRISAMTVNGSGPMTPWLQATTYSSDLDESQVPPRPARLQAKPMANSIIVQWAPPAPDSNILVRGYILGYGRGIADVYQVRLDADTHDYTIKNLQPASEYVISIKALNNIGSGPSRYDTVLTSEDIVEEPSTPMMPPIGLKAIVLTSTTIVLTWADDSLGKSQKIVDNRYYTVRYSALPRGRNKYQNATDLVAHIEGLRANTQYTFAVRVINGRRQSTWSMSVTNTTLEDEPGSEPRDLTPVTLDNDPLAVSLHWQPPQRPNGQITGYLIFYTTDAQQDDRDWVVEGVVGERLSTVIAELTPDTTYYFKVQARNRKGYGPMSNTVKYRTPAVTESQQTQGEESGGLPVNIIIIIIVCVVGIGFCVAIALITIFLCRRRDNAQTRGSYKSPVKAAKAVKGSGKDVPPDLWIHQPSHMELQNMDKGRRSESSVSVATSTLPRVSHTSTERLDELPGNAEVERRRNSFVGESGYPSSGEERYQPVQPRNIIRPKPITLPVDTQTPPREPIATVTALPNGHMLGYGDGGMAGMRPVYPRTQYNTQYAAQPPRVHAGDIPHSAASRMTGSAVDTGDGEDRMVGENAEDNFRIGYGPRSPDSSTAYFHAPSGETASQFAPGRGPRGLNLPCTSPEGAPTTPTPRHIGRVKPQPNLSPYKKPSAPVTGPAKTRSPLPFTPGKAPDVTQHGKKQQDLTKSLSTEELSAEMANLEGLMKDLNAITQQEFEC